MIVSSAVFLWF